MIEIVKKNRKKKTQTPYYELTAYYMIGDANGNTSETMEVCESELETVEKALKILNRLKPTKGTWGIVFDGGFGDFYSEGQITEDEHDFLHKVCFDGYDYEAILHENYVDEGYSEEEAEALAEKEANNDDEIGMLQEIIRGETEYSFLVFEGLSLHYYDEYGDKHETKIS